MPLVDITLIGEVRAAPALSAELAQAIGQALGAAEGSVWVTLHRLAAGDYAENGPAPEPPPVFARVLAHGDDSSGRAAMAATIAAAVASQLGLPEARVHVIFDSSASGRVYFGGRPDSG